MQRISSLKVLDDDQENLKMVSKLPRWAAVRWGRLAYNWREENDSFPPFSEFVKFIVKEADIACDPVNLRKINKEEDNKRPKNVGGGGGTPGGKFPVRHDRNPRNTMATKSKEGDPNDANRPKNENPTASSCIFCKGSQELDSCEGFCKKDIHERKEYTKSKGLCFGCLKQGHLSKHCKNRKTCKTCGKSHPTSLHGDIKKREVNKDNSIPPEEAASPTVRCTKTCFMNNGYQYRISSMIVPVWVNHANNPPNQKLVYALLDDQSDTTFISKEVLDYLQVNGPKTQLSLSTMHAKNELVRSERIKGLEVSDINHSTSIKLPTTFSCETIPAKGQQIPCPEMANSWLQLKPIAHHLIPLRNDIPIGILIGSNCSQAIMPREVIPGNQNEPYAQRTDLGWGIIGNEGKSMTDESDHLTGIVHRVTTESISPTAESSTRKACHFSIMPTIKEVINPAQLREMMELVFSEKGAEQPMSQDDKKFLSILEKDIRQREDGHYEMPLPFREETPVIPNNKALALRRLQKLLTRLENNKKYCEDYINFMNELFERNNAVRVPENELEKEDGKVWYIPPHGVYHPRKPEKIRVVFDCSATYQGESINNHLLQGPDLTNQLVGVLCRFRTEPTAFMCDVEGMFHQFKVLETHRNFLRFLWWEDSDTTKRPVEYRMTVHLFGAGSSPGCANYGLKRIADDHEEECGSEAANFVRNNFYVDDGLKSVENTKQATNLIQKTKDLCAKGGLRLHKFISSSKEVIAAIPQKDRASTLKNLDLHNDRTNRKSTWSVLVRRVRYIPNAYHSSRHPLTRRGILSTISSIYDPLGFVAPVLLVGKQLLQELCRDKVDWDDPVPDHIRARWEKWRSELLLLNDFKVQRCFKPTEFGPVKSIELHHFSDASTSGYGQCSYLRLLNVQEEVHCELVMAKSRVSPLKSVTIPRLELTAALVSVKVSTMLHKELDYDKIVDVSWTDSKVVLGYINNDIFVANRIQQIRDETVPEQWRHVRSEENPPGEASRGQNTREFLKNKRWLSGPSFLWEPQPDQVDVDELIPFHLTILKSRQRLLLQLRRRKTSQRLTNV